MGGDVGRQTCSSLLNASELYRMMITDPMAWSNWMSIVELGLVDTRDTTTDGRDSLTIRMGLRLRLCRCGCGRSTLAKRCDEVETKTTVNERMTTRTKRSLQWGRQSDGMKRKAFNSDDQRLSALIKHSAARSTAATLKLGSKRGYAWDIGPRLNSWLDTFHGLPSVALWRATRMGTPSSILSLLPLLAGPGFSVDGPPISPTRFGLDCLPLSISLSVRFSVE